MSRGGKELVQASLFPEVVSSRTVVSLPNPLEIPQTIGSLPAPVVFYGGTKVQYFANVSPFRALYPFKLEVKQASFVPVGNDRTVLQLSGRLLQPLVAIQFWHEYVPEQRRDRGGVERTRKARLPLLEKKHRNRMYAELVHRVYRLVINAFPPDKPMCADQLVDYLRQQHNSLIIWMLIQEGLTGRDLQHRSRFYGFTPRFMPEGTSIERIYGGSVVGSNIRRQLEFIAQQNI